MMKIRFFNRFVYMMALAIFASSALFSEIVQLTAENNEKIVNSSKALVVDVYTDWCPPCKQLAPIYNSISQEYGDRYQFAKLNAEQQRSLADKYQIQAFPTILFFKDGKLVGKHVGFMPKDKFVAEMKRFLNE